jgi:hypothetical protein
MEKQKAARSYYMCLLTGVSIAVACGGDAPTGPMTDENTDPITGVDGDADEADGDEADGDEADGDEADGDEADGAGDADGEGEDRDGDDEPSPDGDDPEPGDGDSGTDGSDQEPGPSAGFLRGEQVAKDNVCASCHQDDFGGLALYPNITPDPVNGIGEWSDAEIAQAITSGKARDGGMLCSAMPRAALSSEEVSDLIEFLRGIPAVSRKSPAECN